MPATFYSETDWEQSSEPFLAVAVQEPDIWPIADNSGSGTKDTLTDGEHVVVAIGGRTAADGRPLNLTGVVVSYNANATIAQINIADGTIVRAYVTNILTYSQGAAATWEGAPVIGQPVYVDDSNDLAEGTTLSMSPLNDADVKNPQAGVLWYCQDEYLDHGVGGPNASAVWPKTWSSIATTEYLVCVLLFNGSRELA